MNRKFKYVIPDKMLADRQMDKKQYKEISHYLRLACRQAHRSINWERFDNFIMDSLLLGRCRANYEDFLI